MSNTDEKIQNVFMIITEESPAAAAGWMAVQQANSLEAKNKAGYQLFKLTVGLLNLKPPSCIANTTVEKVDKPPCQSHEISGHQKKHLCQNASALTCTLVAS